jgi:transposase
MMRGDDQRQSGMFSYVSAEARVPQDHPLRVIRAMVERSLTELSPRFEGLYAKTGRPSIAPERLLRALLLQLLYSVRSERQLMEQLDYNLLFRWFVGLNADDPVWAPTVFTKNRDRLLSGGVAQAFFESVLAQAKAKRLLSTDHFTVDGTLIEAWASQKSLVRREGPDDRDSDDDPGNPTVNFRGERRSNETHVSATDPDARLVKRRGQASRLAFMGHVLMENRNGLVVEGLCTEADGYAEREAALAMLGDRRGTLGADRGYDAKDFVAVLRQRGVTPHVAQHTIARPSAIDGRTTRHATYAESQRKRKRVEEIFGWLKTVGLLRKVRHRGLDRVGWVFTFALAAYNLVRMRKLLGAT